MRSIRNCSAVVVGGAGFLGSHLVQHLVEDRGCEVSVIDNLVAGRREFLHKDARFFHADITQSEEALKQIFREVKAKYVFNYAAWPYVPSCYARPKLVCDVNFLGAIQVINAAQEAGAEAILQVSSAEIYGSEMRIMGDFGEDNTPGLVLEGKSPINHFAGNGKMREDYTAEPHSSYGVSKLAVDNFVACAWKERQTPCIALRQFNCCGRRETHDYIVPTIISQLFEYPNCCPLGLKRTRDAEVKLGNNSFRDFLHAQDAVEMAVELLEKGEYGGCYNSGSESGIKMYDLAKLIGRVVGFEDVTVQFDESRVRKHEIWHLLSCNDKLYSTISYRPKYDLRKAVEDAVDWYVSAGRKWPWESDGSSFCS